MYYFTFEFHDGFDDDGNDLFVRYKKSRADTAVVNLQFVGCRLLSLRRCHVSTSVSISSKPKHSQALLHITMFMFYFEVRDVKEHIGLSVCDLEWCVSHFCCVL